MDPFGKDGKPVSSEGGKFVSVGDKEGQIPSIEGILLGIRESTKYPGTFIYEIGTRDKTVQLGGNKFFEGRVTEVGALYRIAYTGMSTGKNGRRFKTFDIETVDAATTKKEGYDKLYKSGFDVEPAAIAADDEDDDLPF
jgi:hypothetical protein